MPSSKQLNSVSPMDGEVRWDPFGHHGDLIEGVLLQLSVQLLEVRFAEYTNDVNSRSRSFEDHAIVSGPQSIEILLEPLKLFDAFPIWNGIVGETGTVGKNLVGNLV